MRIFEIGERVVENIKAKGVEGEVMLCDSSSTTVSQRLLKPEEDLRSKNCQIGIRIIIDEKRYSCVSSNNLEEADNLIDAAVAIASTSSEDPYMSLSDSSARYDSDTLELFDSSTIADSRIREILSEMEEEALSYDGRITNSEGASFSRVDTEVLLLTSRGFYGTYKKSCFSSSLSVVAADNGKMEVDYSFSLKTHLNDLENPKTLGREAASRALRKLGARELKTCKLPIVFENRVASSLLKNFASSIKGNAVADGTSFLAKDMGSRIFAEGICIVDDPTINSGIASRAFDGEGIASKVNEVVKDGVLQSWILDMRTAKQLGLQTTGNAVRRADASVGQEVSNLYIKKGNLSPADLMLDIKTGLYVTDVFGFGVNLTTGNYSQGVFGFMIENGNITHPVHGVAVAGNLRDMFLNMSVADDLLFRGSVNSPTLRFQEMVVSGTA